jgi:Cys-rich four helix bundle protein (predicted Tat secretion target)
MDRREALLNTTAIAIAASLSAIASGAKNAGAQAAIAPTASGGAGLVDAAFDCQKKGELCEQHCVHLLSTGDTSMAECLMAVREMLPATAALAHLSSMGSKHVPAAARLALEVCEACEAACRTHAQVHAVCSDCADSCARTIAACRKVST